MDADAIDVLVRRAQAGDKASFRELYVALERDLRLFISARVHDPELVDEILQASFVGCYEHLREYEPRGTFVSWLKGIARHRLLQEFDARRRTHAAGAEDLETVLDRCVCARVEVLPESAGEERLQECLKRLQATSRRLVAARYGDALSIRQISRVFEQTENWVYVTLHRARAFLRACVKGKES
jgi:RNA polymerase sigma-70 factor (ECF subfamily)